MASKIELKLKSNFWLASVEGRPVAEIHLDFWRQVDEVVLYNGLTEDDRIGVLRLCASHAVEFIRNRYGVHLKETERPDMGRTPEESDRLMPALPTAKFAEMSEEDVLEFLKRFEIGIVAVKYMSLDAALRSVYGRVGLHDLKYSPLRLRHHDSKVVRFLFKTKSGHFTFWNSLGTPNPASGFDLHIIPDYHPDMMGSKSVGLINGATNAYISGKAVKDIICPRQAQAKCDRNVLLVSWTHVRHPCYAKGRSFEAAIHLNQIRSEEGMDELVALLRAALGLDKTHVSVSGGFQPPLRCPTNRLNETATTSPWPKANYSGNIARGSESHCVWTHRVLEQEGRLRSAYVPSWFYEEDWLGIYKGAGQKVGLY